MIANLSEMQLHLYVIPKLQLFLTPHKHNMFVLIFTLVYVFASVFAFFLFLLSFWSLQQVNSLVHDVPGALGTGHKVMNTVERNLSFGRELLMVANK